MASNCVELTLVVLPVSSNIGGVDLVPHLTSVVVFKYATGYNTLIINHPFMHLAL